MNHDAARRTSYKLIKEGTLIPQPCEICGTTEKIDGHHDDYNKPDVVIWLCHKDHMTLHNLVRRERRAWGVANTWHPISDTNPCGVIKKAAHYYSRDLVWRIGKRARSLAPSPDPQ